MCNRTALDGAEHKGMCVLHSSDMGKSHDAFRVEFDRIWSNEKEPKLFSNIFVPITVEITTLAMRAGIVFQRCEFWADVIGAGYESTRGISFQGCTFHGKVSITEACTSEIYFEDCTFKRKLVLSGITGPANSDGASLAIVSCHCYGQTLISNVVVAEYAGKNTRYHGTVSMGKMKVKGDINHQSAYFEKSLDVDDVNVSGSMLLSHVETKDYGISVVRSSIGGSISLCEARVQGDLTILTTSVEGAIQGLRLECGSLMIGQSQIRGIMHFYSLRVNARLALIRSICRNTLDLSGATLQGDVYLSHCVLYALNMSGGMLAGRMDYLDVHIISHGNFIGLRISSSARFQSVVKAHRLLFSGEMIYMDGIVLLGGAELSFAKCDFRSVSFRGTDLSRAKLANVEWPRLENGMLCVQNEISEGVERRTAVEWMWSCEIPEIIEKLLSQSGSRISRSAKRKYLLNDLRDQYRDLKQNYSERGAYSEGGEFHIAEKEMARINHSTRPIDRLVLWLYRASSYYGERYIRPAMWSVLVIAISALVYRAFTADYVTALKHSAGVFFLRWPDKLLPLENGSQLGLYHVVYYCEMLAGPALISLMLFALRQRMKR